MQAIPRTVRPGTGLNRRSWHRLFAACLFGLYGVVAAAAAVDSAQQSAAETLAQALAQLEQLSGTFTQSIQEGEPRASSESFSSGRFGLMRPARFFWEIERPDSQLLVVNEGQLWHYDRDLQTATQRPLEGSAALPLQILAGDREVLLHDFRVSSTEPGMFILDPLTDDTGFSQLSLWLEQGLPVRMQLLDELGRQIDIRFAELSRSGLAPADFLFSPPPGVDVYRAADQGD